MRNIKYFIFFIAITSCLQSGVEQVRIVDSKGNPAEINKIVPKFNEEQMNKQKKAFANNNQNSYTKINKFRQDYNNNLSSISQRNNFSNDFNSNNNAIFTTSNNYPNDIFADRITNYNYIKTNEFNSEEPYIKNKKIRKAPLIMNGEDSDTNLIQYKSSSSKNQIKNKILINSYSKKTKTKQVNEHQKPITKKGYYIQIGVYGKKSNANSSYKKYSTIKKGVIEDYMVKKIKKYKVLLGPYKNKKNAEKDLKKVIKTGHYDVYITEKK